MERYEDKSRVVISLLKKKGGLIYMKTTFEENYAIIANSVVENDRMMLSEYLPVTPVSFPFNRFESYGLFRCNHYF